MPHFSFRRFFVYLHLLHSIQQSPFTITELYPIFGTWPANHHRRSGTKVDWTALFVFACLVSPLHPHVLSVSVLACAIIHSLNMVHRDMKPDNILLSLCNDGQEVVVKLADYGLAREVESHVEMTRCGFGWVAFRGGWRAGFIFLFVVLIHSQLSSLVSPLPSPLHTELFSTWYLPIHSFTPQHPSHHSTPHFPSPIHPIPSSLSRHVPIGTRDFDGIQDLRPPCRHLWSWCCVVSTVDGKVLMSFRMEKREREEGGCWGCGWGETGGGWMMVHFSDL